MKTVDEIDFEVEVREEGIRFLILKVPFVKGSVNTIQLCFL